MTTTRQRSKAPKRKNRYRARVLWVDDDLNLTACYARSLRREGIQVISATDGMDGYWQTVTNPPDVIITDLRMPRWEGPELLECLLNNAATVDIPCIVLSGYVTDTMRAQLQRQGISTVLDKPASFNQIRAALRRAGIR